MYINKKQFLCLYLQIILSFFKTGPTTTYCLNTERNKHQALTTSQLFLLRPLTGRPFTGRPQLTEVPRPGTSEDSPICHTSKCSHDYCTWRVKLLCHIPPHCTLVFFVGSSAVLLLGSDEIIKKNNSQTNSVIRDYSNK